MGKLPHPIQTKHIIKTCTLHYCTLSTLGGCYDLFYAIENYWDSWEEVGIIETPVQIHNEPYKSTGSRPFPQRVLVKLARS